MIITVTDRTYLNLCNKLVTEFMHASAGCELLSNFTELHYNNLEETVACRNALHLADWMNYHKGKSEQS